MNITPRFRLVRKHSSTPTTIQARIRFNYKELVYGTGVSILPSLWDAETQRPTTDKKLLSKYFLFKDQVKTIKSRLDKIHEETGKFLLYCETHGNTFTLSELKEYLDSKFKPEKIQTTKNITLNEYIAQYIDDMETGVRTNDKGARFSPGTIKNYRGFQVQFNNFQKETGRNLDFNGITLSFYNKFVAYFNRKNASPNTTGRHIKTIKVIMRASMEEGLHNNQDFTRRKFITIKTEVKSIYLTAKEVKQLHNLDLSQEPKLQLIRDVFLCGCYTGLRYSDYSRISDQYIKENEGYKAIDMDTKKTGQRVVIPIRQELEEILLRYNWNLPPTVEQTLNKEVKNIAARVGITEKVEKYTHSNGVAIAAELVNKNTLITSHTARRTALTQMYLAGMNPTDIMKISGHKTEKNFRLYLKLNEQETADKVAGNKFFNPSLLKAVK